MLIVTFSEGADVHPDSFVTVNLYVLAVSPGIVAEEPDPGYLISPGVLIMIHSSDKGSPFKITLPVGLVQEG